MNEQQSENQQSVENRAEQADDGFPNINVRVTVDWFDGDTKNKIMDYKEKTNLVEFSKSNLLSTLDHQNLYRDHPFFSMGKMRCENPDFSELRKNRKWA